MTARKFAPITASILARKGEAKPWQDPDMEDQRRHGEWATRGDPIRPALVRNSTQQPSVGPATDGPSVALQKKCSVQMSFQEYEQLGILAVKKDCTRQQLLREALADLFTALARDYRKKCPCLEGCKTERDEITVEHDKNTT